MLVLALNAFIVAYLVLAWFGETGGPRSLLRATIVKRIMPFYWVTTFGFFWAMFAHGAMRAFPWILTRLYRADDSREDVVLRGQFELERWELALMAKENDHLRDGHLDFVLAQHQDERNPVVKAELVLVSERYEPWGAGLLGRCGGTILEEQILRTRKLR